MVNQIRKRAIQAISGVSLVIIIVAWAVGMIISQALEWIEGKKN